MLLVFEALSRYASLMAHHESIPVAVLTAATFIIFTAFLFLIIQEAHKYSEKALSRQPALCAAILGFLIYVQPLSAFDDILLYIYLPVLFIMNSLASNADKLRAYADKHRDSKKFLILATSLFALNPLLHLIILEFAQLPTRLLYVPQQALIESVVIFSLILVIYRRFTKTDTSYAVHCLSQLPYISMFASCSVALFFLHPNLLLNNVVKFMMPILPLSVIFFWPWAHSISRRIKYPAANT